MRHRKNVHYIRQTFAYKIQLDDRLYLECTFGALFLFTLNDLWRQLAKYFRFIRIAVIRSDNFIYPEHWDVCCRVQDFKTCEF